MTYEEWLETDFEFEADLFYFLYISEIILLLLYCIKDLFKLLPLSGYLKFLTANFGGKMLLIFFIILGLYI